MDKLLELFTTNVAYAKTNTAIEVFVGKINRRITNPLIIFAFAVALAYFLFGIVEFILNSANPGEKQAGKQRMIWGLIGMFVMFSVFGILKLIENTFGIDVKDNPFLDSNTI